MLFCRKTLLFFKKSTRNSFSFPLLRPLPAAAAIAPSPLPLTSSVSSSGLHGRSSRGVQYPLCSSHVRHQNSSLMGRSSRWCSRSGNVLDVMRSSPSPSHCTISPTSSGGAIGTTTSFFLGSSPSLPRHEPALAPLRPALPPSGRPCASGRSYPRSWWPPSRPNTSLPWPQRQAAGALVK